MHPDYALRSSALREMKNRWYSLSREDITSVIVGHLRDGQYELALEKLEQLYQSAMVNPPWLYHIFVYVFGELGFHAESFNILQHQVKIYGPNQPPAMWQFLLDVYSRDAFYTGIRYIWDRVVTPGILNPPDGTITSILNTASKHGDTDLVMGVMRMLTDRGKRLDLHHYEALIHAHSLHQEVRKPINVLCVMSKAGLALDSSSTRSIYQMLRDSPSATDEALAIMEEIRQQYQVPIAAFNVVLEATSIHKGFQKALDLYRGVRHISTGGPDLATYHVLLRHCTMKKSMKFLVDEMETFSIRPDETTYDHLIRISTLQDDYRPAFLYLDKMRSSETAGRPNNWWMSKSSALALTKRCIEAEDGRVQHIIDICRDRGMSIDAEVRKLLRHARDSKELKTASTEVDIVIEEGSHAIRLAPLIRNRLAGSMSG